MATHPAMAFDYNVTRALNERPPQNQPFVYVDDFQRSTRMAFARNVTINIRDGTKDYSPTNMDRVRVLNDHPGQCLPHAAAEYQLEGELPLADSIQGFTDKRGTYLASVPYIPNPDARLETVHAIPFRGLVTHAQINIAPRTYQLKYTHNMYIYIYRAWRPGGLHPDRGRLHEDVLAPPRHTGISCSY